MKQKKVLYGLLIIPLVLLKIFEPSTLLTNPLLTPNQYLEGTPNILISFLNTIIIVPSSTIIVFVLGFVELYVSYNLYKSKLKGWAYAFFFWAIGTFLAGISYQGFGYELKCAGYEYCLFTSWFELAYLYVTAISISLISLSFSALFLKGKSKDLLDNITKILLIVYSIILMLGSIIENRFLVSYELFTAFFMPLFVVFFIINVKQFYRKKDPQNKVFIRLWIYFLIVNLSYYVYYFLGITEDLYDKYEIWFSANDVLHIALILWMIFIIKKVKNFMK